MRKISVQLRFLSATKKGKINDADRSCNIVRNLFLALAVPVEENGYFGNLFRIETEPAGRINKSSKYFTGELRILNLVAVLALKGKRLGVLQAQGVPRRCNSGLAQQNGTKGGGVMIEVYIDGSSKGNPGPGGAGIVIQDKATQETLGIHGIGPSRTTSRVPRPEARTNRTQNQRLFMILQCPTDSAGRRDILQN
jgi:hypothetical protein